ncbi:MAG: phenylalanine 4-monooxygenase [Endozoicomonas sp.]
MKKPSTYTARKPDGSGFIRYSAEEHETWKILYERQMKILPGRACSEFLDGLELLRLPPDRIPQLSEVQGGLEKTTGWGVTRVPALISFDRFFKLLSERQFPVATFIRTREDLDYLQEPDIFHEIFGHCPLLTNQGFADFTATYGRLGLEASKEERVYLARLYWMTVEFGLLSTPEGLRIYGGGILSSYSESLYCLDSDKPARKAFDALEALRTPYRIDILQPLYYLLDDLSALQALAATDIMSLVHEAVRFGLHVPLYDPADNDDSA